MHVTYFVPTGLVSGKLWRCGKENDPIAFPCGCPQCLKDDGLTLIWNAEDVESAPDFPGSWRVRIASQETIRKTGLQRLIVEPYRNYFEEK